MNRCVIPEMRIKKIHSFFDGMQIDKIPFLFLNAIGAPEITTIRYNKGKI
jgi:hypothetical protein